MTGSLNEERVLASPEIREIREIRETASGVAHGLNNLLGAVAGLAAQLLDVAAADRAVMPVEELRLIHQAALDGLELNRRLLHLSRGQPSLDATSLELVDLARTVRDAVDLTRPCWHDQALARGLTIEPLVAVEQPLLVRGIPSDLREIIINLIQNAVDAMPDGGRLCLRGEQHGESVIITCQDSGAGMPPDVLARVFEPFFTTKGERGTGMGLPIVRNVVERLGGDARVTSEVGVGTRVTLRLPAAEPLRDTRMPPLRRTASAPVASGAAVAPVTSASSVALVASASSIALVASAWSIAPVAPASSIAPVAPASSVALAVPARAATGHAPAWTGPAHRASDQPVVAAMRARAITRAATAEDLAASLATRTVLVVEDDPIFRAVFMRRLGLDARRVTAVEDAASALAALETGGWDVLCVDDGLPDRPGRELAAEIRRRGLACAVILVTGTATAPDDPHLAGPGVDAILPKPCTDAELARALRVACARQAERSSTPA